MVKSTVKPSSRVHDDDDGSVASPAETTDMAILDITLPQTSFNFEPFDRDNDLASIWNDGSMICSSPRRHTQRTVHNRTLTLGKNVICTSGTAEFFANGEVINAEALNPVDPSKPNCPPLS